MSHPFTHPASEEILKRVAQIFHNRQAFISQRRSLLFVCGGPVGPKKQSLRNHFLNFARLKLPDFAIFLAEAAAKDVVTYGEENFLNLAAFEKFLSEVADCIIVFPEAPGAHAETGYFSADSKIYKKILIANDIRFQSSESFINNGPIDHLNKKSHFRPVIQIVHCRAATDFSHIAHRLARLKHKKREKLSSDIFTAMSVKEQLFITLEIVRIFTIVDLEMIYYALKRLFNDYRANNVRRYMSILLSSDYIQRIGMHQDLFRLTKKYSTFIEYDGIDIEKIQLQIIGFYQTNTPNHYKLLDARP